MMKWHKLGDLYINEEALTRILALSCVKHRSKNKD